MGYIYRQNMFCQEKLVFHISIVVKEKENTISQLNLVQIIIFFFIFC